MMLPTRSLTESGQSTQLSWTSTRLEAEVRGDGGDLAGVVGLVAADGDQGVGALREGVGDEVLELAGLVAAVGEPAVAVLALGPDRGAAEVRRSAGRSGWTGLGPNSSG